IRSSHVTGVQTCALPICIVGSATPDAKIVRISLDDDSTGAGIHLNDQLSYRQFGADYVTLDAYFREWSTDAIAQDYRFAFNASRSEERRVGKEGSSAGHA